MSANLPNHENHWLTPQAVYGTGVKYSTQERVDDEDEFFLINLFQDLEYSETRQYQAMLMLCEQMIGMDADSMHKHFNDRIQSLRDSAAGESS